MNFGFISESNGIVNIDGFEFFLFALSTCLKTDEYHPESDIRMVSEGAK